MTDSLLAIKINTQQNLFSKKLELSSSKQMKTENDYIMYNEDGSIMESEA
jgi:hypothetical protein